MRLHETIVLAIINARFLLLSERRPLEGEFCGSRRETFLFSFPVVSLSTGYSEIARTSSTERVPRMARKWPSRVWRMVSWTSCDVLPRNCSDAVVNNSLAVIILHWATPVTVSGTPWAVSTCSQTGFNVITCSQKRRRRETGDYRYIFSH